MTENVFSCILDCIMNEEFLSKIRMCSGKDMSTLKAFSISNKGETTLKSKSSLFVSYCQLIMAQRVMSH